ncbi:hypothetical protein ACLMJK_000641 [Lecanora helva]
MPKAQKSKGESLTFQSQRSDSRIASHNHPTISQDWTNVESNEDKRLFALRGKEIGELETIPNRDFQINRDEPVSFDIGELSSDLRTFADNGAASQKSARLRKHSVDWLSQGSTVRQNGLESDNEPAEVASNESNIEHNVTKTMQRKRRRKDHNALRNDSEPAAGLEWSMKRGGSGGEDTSQGQQHIDQKTLRRELETLRRDNARLKCQLRGPQRRYQIIYTVHNASDQSSTIMYLDQPQWVTGDKNMASLQGQLPVTRLDSYLDRHPEVVFLVFRDITVQGSDFEADDELSATQWSERISIKSSRLIANLKQIANDFSSIPSIRENLGLHSSEVTLAAPYLAFYHSREMLVEHASFMGEGASIEWNLLLHYIDSNFGEQHRHVKTLLDRGTIHRDLIHYMIKEGDTLISQRNHTRSAYVAVSRPNLVPHSSSNVQNASKFEDFQQLGHQLSHLKPGAEATNFTRLGECSGERKNREVEVWQIEVECWEFDGNFQKIRQTIQLRIPNGSSDTLSIRDLELFPIRFAEDERLAQLKAAGSEFWKSRIRRYVSYRPNQRLGGTDSAELRYMIDPATYKKLHNKDTSRKPCADDLGPDLMNGEDPPPDPFLLLLPNTIDGFNMQNKRWEKLEVSYISEVSWNKGAFDSLVIDPFAKKLVKALVMQHLEREKGTDLISGKGQGLIALLHGGPGTGKTFTAETVAEIAEKPLYRVTCGDLGADPAKVEDYLESVLYLGKIWNCVVLLDEADVYLEERSMESLARNALVSVFLRVLEYYEGILILTSNRVGTLDESFKSRIQLPLHYDRLKFQDRCTIWENFFRRLENFAEVAIDFDDIYRHLKDLARNELNGRQIRNAITTSRQLARHQGKDLVFSDLQQVIEVTLKFDKHTTDLQGGMNDDERKREDGIRP